MLEGLLGGFEFRRGHFIDEGFEVQVVSWYHNRSRCFAVGAAVSLYSFAPDGIKALRQNPSDRNFRMKIIFAGLLAGLIAGIVIVGGNRWLAAQDKRAAVQQAEKNERELADIHRRTCLNQLRMIHNAIQQWAVENGKTDYDAVTASELTSNMVGGWPHCPAGGDYNFKNAGNKPTCTVRDHKLP